MPQTARREAARTSAEAQARRWSQGHRRLAGVASGRPPDQAQGSRRSARAEPQARRRRRGRPAARHVGRAAPQGLQPRLRPAACAGRRCILRLPDGTERETTLTAARETDKALLVRIAGVDDRNAAEALRGAEICVPRAALPPPEEGEFYAWDLEGAAGRADVRASPWARCSRLTSYPTCDVLVVDRARTAPSSRCRSCRPTWRGSTPRAASSSSAPSTGSTETAPCASTS